jgi:hypothetical protein
MAIGCFPIRDIKFISTVLIAAKKRNSFKKTERRMYQSEFRVQELFQGFLDAIKKPEQCRCSGFGNLQRGIYFCGCAAACGAALPA